MEYSPLLTQIADQCTQSPIEFTVELDIQARLTETVRKKFREKNRLQARFADDRIEYTGQSANYKESYVDHFLTKVRQAETPFSRVHTEVAPYEELIDDLDSRERIDVVVFSEQLEHPIRWRGGSQRHHWDDYDAAIEIKYVKNKNKFPAEISETEILDTSIASLRSQIDFTANSIGSDIAELERLPASVDRYLLLVSNHDYLYRGPIADLDHRRQQRYSRLADAAVAELQDRVEQTHILYVHPTGWQWLTGNGIQDAEKPQPGDSA